VPAHFAAGIGNVRKIMLQLAARQQHSLRRGALQQRERRLQPRHGHHAERSRRVTRVDAASH
jgi:hypothetical protein